MSRVWNGKALIDEVATRVWDTSDAGKERVRKWLNEIQDDLTRDVPLDTMLFRMKKVMAKGVDIHDLSPEIPGQATATLASGGTLVDTTKYKVYVTFMIFDEAEDRFIESEPSIASAEITADASNGTISLSAIPTHTGDDTTLPNVIKRRIYVAKKAVTDSAYGEPLFDQDIEDNITTTATITSETTSTITPPSDSEVDHVSSEAIRLAMSNKTLRQINKNRVHRSDPDGNESTTPDYFDYYGPRRVKIYPKFSAGGYDIDPDALFQLKAFLHSADGTTTPTLTSNTYMYNNTLNETINYLTAGDFTYDSTTTEFTGSLVQLLASFDSTEAYFFKFDADLDSDRNRDGSVISGTATGGAAIVSGKLDITGGSKYVTYDASDFTPADGDVVAIRFKYTPDYSGTPGSNRFIFYLGATSSDINGISFRHRSGAGGLELAIFNSSGSSIVAYEPGSWSPTAGTEYEIYCHFDTTTGDQKIFIDGVQLGTTGTSTGTRTETGYQTLIIGADRGGVQPADGYIRDFQIFDAIQDNADFSADVPRTVGVDKYNTGNPTVLINATVAMKMLNTFAETKSVSGSDAVKYTIVLGGTDYYVVSGALVESDGTYAQSSTAAEINTLFATAATEDQRLLIYSVYRRPHEIHYDVDREIDLPISSKKALVEGAVWKAYEFRDRDGHQSKMNNYETFKQQWLRSINRRQRGRPGPVRDVNGDTWGFEV